MDEEAEVDKQDAIDVEKLDGEVKLENVDFSYNKNKKVLNKISLTAHKGQTIAIVGPTGSGKTTIINLLNKFYHIDRGTITIDGVDIDNITMESLRKSVAVVLQDTYLFSVSIRENLRYGNLNATDEEIIKAAKLANAHHFIMQLEDGYDTVLSDNGSNLSQGQRQLLAIARAILSKSSILILDEATSSIDTRTEVHIQNAMVNLMEGKTTFIIAHRLSTIRNADVILAVKDGEIIEKGTHDELLEAEGFYANLYKKEGFRGGHIILLNARDSEYYEATKKQAMGALQAYPGGLQVGGGITAENAEEFLTAGASHVIVTSYVFCDGKIQMDRLKKLRNAVGKEHLVLDLSCRKKDGKYYIVTDRWQRFTEQMITEDLLEQLAGYCDEFLVHAVDVEGKASGIEEELVRLLGSWGKIPVTYAGGVGDFEDLARLKKLGKNMLNVTIGSALDLFGGTMSYEKVKEFCRE